MNRTYFVLYLILIFSSYIFAFDKTFTIDTPNRTSLNCVSYENPNEEADNAMDKAFHDIYSCIPVVPDTLFFNVEEN